MNSTFHHLQRQLSTPNLGIGDCLARILVGLILTALAVDGTIGAWGLLGLAILATGAAWVCPVYRAFGFSTASGPVPVSMQH